MECEFQVKSLVSLFDNLLCSADLDSYAPVYTSNVRSEMRFSEEKILSDSGERK